MDLGARRFDQRGMDWHGGEFKVYSHDATGLLAGLEDGHRFTRCFDEGFFAEHVGSRFQRLDAERGVMTGRSSDKHPIRLHGIQELTCASVQGQVRCLAPELAATLFTGIGTRNDLKATNRLAGG